MVLCDELCMCEKILDHHVTPIRQGVCGSVQTEGEECGEEEE